MKRCIRQLCVLLTGILPLIFLSHFALAQDVPQYTDDLSDINMGLSGYSILHKPTPIGDLGTIETVIDLRGFIPMSLSSKVTGKAFGPKLTDLRWFKIPTRKGLSLLYYGSLSVDQLQHDTGGADEFSRTRFLNESAAQGDAALWCDLAYKMAKDAAPLFEQIGGSGFQGAEPTTVFFTEQSTFIVVNLKYDSLVTDKGQVLIALEFSRFSKRYRTFYILNSTLLVSKPRAEAAVAIAPQVVKVLTTVFGQ